MASRSSTVNGLGVGRVLGLAAGLVIYGLGLTIVGLDLLESELPFSRNWR